MKRLAKRLRLNGPEVTTVVLGHPDPSLAAYSSCTCKCVCICGPNDTGGTAGLVNTANNGTFNGAFNIGNG